jgi:hypothetical protein
MSNHYLTDTDFYTSKDGVKILSPEEIEQEIQQKTEERVRALQNE